MSSCRQLRHRRHTKSQQGAVLVEAAICAILPLLLIAGILEYGSFFGGLINVTSASRSAARAGSETKTAPAGDAAILRALAASPGASRTDIQKVVIYKASGASSAPPAECTASYPAPTDQFCDVYRAQDIGLTDAQLAAIPGAQTWPPSERVPGSDYLGVWVQLSRQPFFGLVWSPTNYSDQFAMLIQPISKQVIVPGGWGQASSTPNPTGDWYCWGGYDPTAGCPGGPAVNTPGDGNPGDGNSGGDSGGDSSSGGSGSNSGGGSGSNSGGGTDNGNGNNGSNNGGGNGNAGGGA